MLPLAVPAPVLLAIPLPDALTEPEPEGEMESVAPVEGVGGATDSVEATELLTLKDAEALLLPHTLISALPESAALKVGEGVKRVEGVPLPLPPAREAVLEVVVEREAHTVAELHCETLSVPLPLPLPLLLR